jgi:hypothetical protein
MSSSRSIAAARNRRANDAPPTPQPQQTRPITSINSATSLKQQQPMNSKPPHPPSQTNTPFNKISVSDAIGLITLRLGKIEQYIIDTQNENKEYELPANAKLVDNSVLISLLSRIETLETKLKDMNANANANVNANVKKENLFDVQKALDFQKQMEDLNNNRN